MSIERFKTRLHVFARLDPNMQITTALAFLLIAEGWRHGAPYTTADIRRLLSLSVAAGDRKVRYWTAEGLAEMPGGGHGFVAHGADATDGRRKLLILTHAGEAFLATVDDSSAVEPDCSGAG